MSRQRKAGKASAPSLRQRAYDEIKRRILDGSFAPDTLLSENQLAEELQISRTPIREALRDLHGRPGPILPQRGVIVTGLSLQEVIEVYQLREQLECFAVRLTAARVGPEEAAAFQADHRAAVEHMRASRLAKAYDSSVLMHGRIIAMARNSRLTQFMQLLSDQVHRFGLLTLRHGRVERALAEHGQIIDALVARDADRAASLMRDHLRADRDMAVRLTLPAGVAGPDFLSSPAEERPNPDLAA